jgi:hypothetical protein
MKMKERLLFDWIDAKARAFPVRVELDLPVLSLANEAEPTVTLSQST